MIASPLLAGCVTSGAYEAALADAQAARIAAARSEAETRALRAEVDALSRRIEAQAPTETEVRSALELVRSLRALGLFEGRAAERKRAAPPAPPATASVAPSPGATPSGAVPSAGVPGRSLDHDDPWASAARAVKATTPRGGLSRRGAASKIAATRPLDAADPWVSARVSARASAARPAAAPPLDASDPW